MQVTLKSGEQIPRLGQGTWRMGESPSDRAREIASLRLGLDLGLTLIDTAEMYGSGGAEEIIAEAIKGKRDSTFIVSKAYPQNAGRKSLPTACENSLRRLATDRIAADLGYTAIALWSATIGDSRPESATQIVDFAQRTFQPQQIVLAHANLPPVTQTYGQLLDIIHHRGLQTVTLSDVFG